MRASFLAVIALAAAGPASALFESAPALWQERFFWDALTSARDKMMRRQSDPVLIPMMKSVAGQVAQQTANVMQIGRYVKAQGGNLRYAYAQADPQPSLATISDNLRTLTAGCDQIRHNLYYLTARERLAQSQALPDQDMYRASLLILGQVQQLQLALNQLYYDAAGMRGQVAQNSWANTRFFAHRSDELLRSVVRIQDSVFAVYNAGYELAMRCR
ncbi:MAG: hypothetical protein HY552_04865 [Elusimicrobia bacterium]|nr:hypothetical protein [Elusimicrobiota bacterium]